MAFSYAIESRISRLPRPSESFEGWSRATCADDAILRRADGDRCVDGEHAILISHTPGNLTSLTDQICTAMIEAEEQVNDHGNGVRESA